MTASNTQSINSAAAVEMPLIDTRELRTRSGSVQLLLYSVFRIGNATNNIRWDSFEQIIILQMK